MDKKGFIFRQAGFVHIIPIIVMAVLTIGALGAIAQQEQKQKEAVGRVLSSSDKEDDNNKGSNSGSQDSRSKSSDEGNKSSDSRGRGSTGELKIESRRDEGKTKIETKPEKTKIEVRTGEGRFETKVEEGKEETKIRTGGLRIEIKREGDLVVTKIKNEQDEEVELEDDEKEELLEDLEEELEEDDIFIATEEAQPGFIQRGHRVRTNFPLSVNAATGELIVSTPAGEKVVAILPEVAIQNMIRAGILTRVIEPPAPVEGTASASVAGAGIELTQVNNQPVFVISGVRSQRFLGLVPVDIRVRAVVSVENGQLVDLQQGLLPRILDLVSF